MLLKVCFATYIPLRAYFCYNFRIMEQEVWKDIVWYEWLYQVSNLGRVKSLKRWLLKTHNRKDGYIGVWLYKNNRDKKYLLHRIVYMSFNNLSLDNYNPYEKTCVCHIDDNPSNCKLSNLFLWTHKDNMNDRDNKSRLNNSWLQNHNSKLLFNDIIRIQVLFSLKKIKILDIKINTIAQMYSINTRTIYKYINWERQFWATLEVILQNNNLK